ncbi:MAG: hypothetical protein Q8K78_18750, partial [Planctomycetaceae bacterium]|nr:hypothetical protein [Planctomycetaceae bacterium]
MAIPKAIALPAAMESRLRQIRRRQWLFGWLQTAAFGASAFLFALTAALLIDWQWMLRDSRLRLALTGGTFVIAGLVVVATMWWRLRPLLKTSWAAVRADAVIPQLEERWTTVVTLASSPGSAATPAAQAMLQQVVHEAAAMGRLVQPHAVARSESSGRSLALLTVCMLLLLGVLSTDWPQTSVLWRRFWQPTADITATQLMSQTGDTVVPRGESVELASTLTGVPRSQALLLLEREAAPLETIAIASDS